MNTPECAGNSEYTQKSAIAKKQALSERKENNNSLGKTRVYEEKNKSYQVSREPSFKHLYFGSLKNKIEHAKYKKNLMKNTLYASQRKGNLKRIPAK